MPSIPAFAPELRVCWQRGLRPNKAKFAAAPDKRGSHPEASPAIKAQERAMCALTQSPQCFPSIQTPPPSRPFIAATPRGRFLCRQPSVVGLVTPEQAATHWSLPQGNQLQPGRPKIGNGKQSFSGPLAEEPGSHGTSDHGCAPCRTGPRDVVLVLSGNPFGPTDGNFPPLCSFKTTGWNGFQQGKGTLPTALPAQKRAKHGSTAPCRQS